MTCRGDYYPEELTSNRKLGEFYYMGRRFDTLEEMLTYVSEWGQEKITEKSVNRILNLFTNNILVHKHIYGSGITNRQMMGLVEKLFQTIVKEMNGQFPD